MNDGHDREAQAERESSQVRRDDFPDPTSQHFLSLLGVCLLARRGGTRNHHPLTLCVIHRTKSSRQSISQSRTHHVSRQRLPHSRLRLFQSRRAIRVRLRYCTGGYRGLSSTYQSLLLFPPVPPPATNKTKLGMSPTPSGLDVCLLHRPNH